MVRLHVNVDHVATLREARRIHYPDPLEAALLAEKSGAEGITVHLREDRRHIQEQDVERLRGEISTLLNLEMALSREILGTALRVKPDEVCIVPEKRQEITTEGGLDVRGERNRLAEFIPLLKEKQILVSLFIDPEEDQLRCARDLGADYVELHTGAYANASKERQEEELARLKNAATLGKELGLRVNAGHGLNLDNVQPVAQIPEVEELNIGHSIVARAVLVGMEEAVGEMRRRIHEAVEGKQT